MRLDDWQYLVRQPGPLATVSIDVSRDSPTDSREVRLRWQHLERELERDGAPTHVRDTLSEKVFEPTGEGGPTGRLVVVGSRPTAVVLADVVLPVPPARDEAVWGPAPHLVPIVRATAAWTSHLLVVIDRTGADIEVHSAMDDDAVHVEVDGDHNVLHKVSGGGWSHRRMQQRVEDSWDRNAGQVAERVEELVRRHRPSVVLLAGDVTSMATFLDQVGVAVRDRTVRLETGGRADGVSAQAMDAAVQSALRAYREGRRQQVVDRFTAAEGRQDDAVRGLADVVQVLRRGQVDELLLRDDAGSGRHPDGLRDAGLWVGPDPLLLARKEEELAALGVTVRHRVRADVALVRAAVGCGAGVTLLTDDDPFVPDGVAAVLRWSDRSTPHDALPSMPGHGEH